MCFCLRHSFYVIRYAVYTVFRLSVAGIVCVWPVCNFLWNGELVRLHITFITYTTFFPRLGCVASRISFYGHRLPLLFFVLCELLVWFTILHSVLLLLLWLVQLSFLFRRLVTMRKKIQRNAPYTQARARVLKSPQQQWMPYTYITSVFGIYYYTWLLTTVSVLVDMLFIFISWSTRGDVWRRWNGGWQSLECTLIEHFKSNRLFSSQTRTWSFHSNTHTVLA